MAEEEKTGWKDENIVVYYHKADLDGIGSAAIIKGIYPKARYIGVNYDTDEMPNMEDIQDKYVIVVDYSFHNMHKVRKNCRQLCWIDHHESAQKYQPEMWNDEAIDGLRDIKRSAIALTWEWFYPHATAPTAVLLIEDHDIWKHEFESTKAFAQAGPMILDSPDHEWWTHLLSADPTVTSRAAVSDIVEMGKVLLMAEAHRIKQGMEAGRIKKFAGFETMLINTNNDTSALGNHVVTTTNCQVAAIWHQSKSKVMVSLFSKDEVNVSEIAKKYGGGGHKHASGFNFFVGDKPVSIDLFGPGGQ